jgi:hypothetical protein
MPQTIGRDAGFFFYFHPSATSAETLVAPEFFLQMVVLRCSIAEDASAPGVTEKTKIKE